jgi:protein-arginine deiminase
LGPLTSRLPVLLQKAWHWGPEGYGAILLVNCDKESHRSTGPDLDHSQLVSLDGE